MSKHRYTVTYIRCDVCGKTSDRENTSFDYNSDWNIEQGIDICDECSENGENGEVWDYRDVDDDMKAPEREDSKMAFVKFNSEGEVKFVKWL